LVRELVRRLTPAAELPPATGAETGLSDEENKQREQAQGSLRTYMRLIWPIIEPRFALIDGFFFDALCDHAQAFALRQIKNIVVTIPPRMSKSSIWSIGLPTWTWTRDARRRLLIASFPGGPNIDHALRARSVIDSLWYQRHFGETVRLRSDQNEKAYYENTAGGYRITTHVGGGTGKGGDLTILDDPHNIEERHSQKKREDVISWHDTTWFGRLDDLVHGGRAVIQQRIHTNDLAGHLLASGEYEHLNLPQEYSKKRTVTVEGGRQLPVPKTSIGWEDPRSIDGALLCPQRMGPQQVAAARKLLGSEFNAQQNQDPLPESGKLFKRTWFKVIETRPIDVVAEVRFWDTAASDEEEAATDGAQTAGLRMLRTQSGKYVITSVLVGKWGAFDVDKMIRDTAKIDGPEIPVREEQEPGGSGKSIIKLRTRAMAGYDYEGLKPTADKVTRAKPLRTQAEAGNVYLLVKTDADRLWAEAFLQEIEQFPIASQKDQVDAASGAFAYLALDERGSFDDPMYPIVH